MKTATLKSYLIHLKGQRTDQIQLIIKLINYTEEKFVLIKVNTEEKYTKNYRYIINLWNSNNLS